MLVLGGRDAPWLDSCSLTPNDKNYNGQDCLFFFKSFFSLSLDPRHHVAGHPHHAQPANCQTSSNNVGIFHNTCFLPPNWRPDKTFFRTNALKDTIARAQNGGKWNHLIFNMPSVVISQVTAPTYANNGVAIRNIEHKSDFIHVKAVQDIGGVYIDFGVYPLRDINALRECSFRVIAGRQVDGQVNGGAFMAARGSEMLQLWMRGMHGRYTGGGTTHSNEVLTRVGERLAGKEREVLIMEREAFLRRGAGGWGPGDVVGDASRGDFQFGQHNAG